MDWEPLVTAPQDGTRILFKWASSDGKVNHAVIYYGIYHPNSPGKTCWRVDWDGRPINFVGEWKAIEVGEDYTLTTIRNANANESR